jgi:hypothetical protein
MERKFLTVNKLNISRIYFKILFYNQFFFFLKLEVIDIGHLLFFVCKSQNSRKIDLTVDRDIHCLIYQI